VSFHVGMLQAFAGTDIDISEAELRHASERVVGGDDFEKKCSDHLSVSSSASNLAAVEHRQSGIDPDFTG